MMKMMQKRNVQSNVLQLGVLFFLFLTLTPGNSVYGPFHAAVDDFGQFYIITAGNGRPELGVFMHDWSKPYPLNAIPERATHLVVAATNRAAWAKNNPAGIILSSDQKSKGPRIISDRTWKCKGYEGTGEKWPISNEAKNGITAAIHAGDYLNWRDAVELGPNWAWKQGTIDKIALGAHWIWADYLGENENLPMNNVICVKALSPAAAGNPFLVTENPFARGNPVIAEFLKDRIKG